MLHAAAEGALALRQDGDGVRLRGSFPYGATATLSDGGRRGRPRKERFAPHAFEYRVQQPDAEIHLLAGHDFNNPLASKLNGSLELEDTAEALNFEARIAPEVADTSFGRDVLALIRAGLAVGLSPGFRLPPERAVEDAESVEEEPVKPEQDMHGALIRTVKAALLYELSIVTRPAYSESQVEARRWSTDVVVPRWPAIARWR